MKRRAYGIKRIRSRVASRNLRAMDKWFWVLFPMLLAGLGLGWLAWRQRLPSRAALNALFSVLLLAYLLATAGLGLFWVANQHLPVFDWHYLFGYAMLALLIVHLAFNARALWRHLTSGAPVVRRAASGSGGRRPWLLALAVLGLPAATGLGYLLGRRHGRTEMRVGDAGTGDAPAGLAVVESFHAQSSHTRAGLLGRAPSYPWGERAPPFHSVPAQEIVSLPPAATVAARDTLPSLPGIGTLLWHTAGISAEAGGIHFRTAPSSGALFASEVYLVVRGLPDLGAGLWHYRPKQHAIARLGSELPDAALLPANALATVIVTAVWARTGHKYGDRSYRYILADLGHALENLCQVAAAMGAGATLLPAFDEAALARRLSVDEAREGVLAQVLLHPRPVRLQRLSAMAAPAPWDETVAMGVTGAIHNATSLRGAIDWSAMASDPPSGLGFDPLPLVAARRSWRRFHDRPLPAAALDRLLAASTAVPPRLSDAVRIHVLTLKVQGREAAAWRWRGAQHGLADPQPLGREHRSLARRAALDQDVVGEAAAVFVLAIARDRFRSEPAGPARGYRHAFIEAGLIGERLYLQGQALGLGVCGVGAFYDEEAAALAGVDPAQEWVVHLVAVGERA